MYTGCYSSGTSCNLLDSTINQVLSSAQISLHLHSPPPRPKIQTTCPLLHNSLSFPQKSCYSSSTYSIKPPSHQIPQPHPRDSTSHHTAKSKPPPVLIHHFLPPPVVPFPPFLLSSLPPQRNIIKFQRVAAHLLQTPNLQNPSFSFTLSTSLEDIAVAAQGAPIAGVVRADLHNAVWGDLDSYATVLDPGHIADFQTLSFISFLGGEVGARAPGNLDGPRY